jgi:hypothetical protein
MLLYNYTDDVLERRVPHRSAHLAHAQAAASRGELLLGGALADPVDGAVIVFAGGADAAERFAADDPYVKAGVVTDWTVREWSTVIGSLSPHVPHNTPTNRPLAPPAAAFAPSYAWREVVGEAELPAGLEVELPLDGKPKRARIPPSWQLAVWVDSDGGGSFWRLPDVRRGTTGRELREAASAHLGRPIGSVSLRLGGKEVGDEATAEQLELFSRRDELSVEVAEAAEE